MSIRSISIARLFYLFLCVAAGFLIALSTDSNEDFQLSPIVGCFSGLGIGIFFIFVESILRDFSLRGFSTATFGILVGLLCAWLLTRVGIDDLIAVAFDNIETAEVVALATRVAIFGTMGFIGASLAIRSAQEDFAFVIPYVRFRSDSFGGKPILPDSEIIMDGRLTQLAKTGFIPSNLVIPSFVIDEIQNLSESDDPKESRAGKRGLQELETLRNVKTIEVNIHSADTELRELKEIKDDQKSENRLIRTARFVGARILTCNDDLVQIAKIQHADILSLSDLQDALQAPVAVGQRIRVHLVKSGKDNHQAVGFHSDGTMIVVNHAVDKIGTTCDARIIGSLNTSSGELFFAEIA